MTQLRDLIRAMAIAAGILLAVVLCQGLPSAPRTVGDGLFSWHADVFEADGDAQLADVLRLRGLSELYQAFPRDLPQERAEDLIGLLARRSIRTFMLTGDPSWGADETGADAVAAVERAASLRNCAGIVLDVEPWTTDAWADDPARAMQTFVTAMTHAKARATERGLELVVCIPYYLDAFADQLERLVTDGCHTLAVMNYQRKDEASQVLTEARLCAAHGVRLINVYELQAIGTNGLTAQNTYHDAGLSALSLSTRNLGTELKGSLGADAGGTTEGTAAPSLRITYAYHDYDALRELMAY